LANFKSADLDRTAAFYQGTLGLPVRHRREIMPGVEEVRFDAGGGILCFE
jgi:catechol 2,3-dioxygenase-like lactoylglutathione lyase family enzyme